MKKLIICPVCESNGCKSILGEIRDDGKMSVLRFHSGETLISGPSFSVTCGRCGTEVFIRRTEVIYERTRLIGTITESAGTYPNN